VPSAKSCGKSSKKSPSSRKTSSKPDIGSREVASGNTIAWDVCQLTNLLLKITILSPKKLLGTCFQNRDCHSAPQHLDVAI
jgi:hypothetical protein